MSSRHLRKKTWPKERKIKVIAGSGAVVLLATFLMLDVGGPLLRSLAGAAALGGVLFVLWVLSEGGKGNGPYSSHTGGMWGQRNT